MKGLFFFFSHHWYGWRPGVILLWLTPTYQSFSKLVNTDYWPNIASPIQNSSAAFIRVIICLPTFKIAPAPLTGDSGCRQSGGGFQWVQGKVWRGLERKKRCDVIIRRWHRGTTQLRRDSEQKIAKICLPVSRIHFLHEHFVRTLPIWIIHAEEPSANRRLHR